jgi:hypothetical protein
MRLVKHSVKTLAVVLHLVAAITVPIPADGGQLTLSWVDTSGDALGFSVERSAGLSDPFVVIGTTAPGVTTYIDTSVSDSGTYCYRVWAFNSIAYSDHSYPACGTTGPAALTFVLNINQDVFALGDHFQLDVNFGQIGAASLVDVTWAVFYRHLRILRPAVRKGIPSSTCLTHRRELRGLAATCLSDDGASGVRLYSNTPAGMLASLMGPNFFSFDWPSATPGDYTIFMTVTRAGTTTVVAQGTVTVSYFP